MYRMQANILVVGIGNKSKALNELPVQLFVMNNCAEAIQCLKNERLDTVVSQWNLIDVGQGQFLKRLAAGRSEIPTIAFIKAGNIRQEMAARSLGVKAVLEDDIDDEYFRNTVCQILGIDSITKMSVREGDNNSNDIFYSDL